MLFEHLSPESLPQYLHWTVCKTNSRQQTHRRSVITERFSSIVRSDGQHVKATTMFILCVIGTLTQIREHNLQFTLKHPKNIWDPTERLRQRARPIVDNEHSSIA